MATIDDLVLACANKLKAAPETEQYRVAQEILSQIGHLDQQFKEQLIKRTYDYLRPPSSGTVRFGNNQQYLQLVNYMLSQINQGKQ